MNDVKTIYMTDDADEVLELVVTEEQLNLLRLLEREYMLAEGVHIKVRNEPVHFYDVRKEGLT